MSNTRNIENASYCQSKNRNIYFIQKLLPFSDDSDNEGKHPVEENQFP